MKRSAILRAIADRAATDALLATASGDPGAAEEAVHAWQLASDAWLVAVKMEIAERHARRVSS